MELNVGRGNCDRERFRMHRQGQPLLPRTEDDLFQLLLAQNARLLPLQFPVAEQGEVGNAAHVVFRRQRRRPLGINLEYQRFSGKTLRCFRNGGSGHFARAAPFCPEIDEHRHLCLVRDLLEKRSIDVNRGTYGRQRLLARATAAGMGEVACGDTIF
jgi:hypothetical protein